MKSRVSLNTFLFTLLILFYSWGWFEDPALAKAPKPPKPPKAVIGADWSEVADKLFSQTMSPPISLNLPTDERYWLPTYEQLTALDKAVRPRLHLHYIDNARDCNHFAFEFYVLAHEWGISEVTGEAPIALAVFVVYAQIHPGAFDGRWTAEGKHAMALILASDGVAWFYDVQSGQHVKVLEAIFEGSIEPYQIVF